MGLVSLLSRGSQLNKPEAEGGWRNGHKKVHQPVLIYKFASATWKSAHCYVKLCVQWRVVKKKEDRQVFKRWSERESERAV